MRTGLFRGLFLNLKASNLKEIKSFSKMANACKEVSSMSDTEVSTWFNSFDTVMTDCDGVLWVGAEPIPGSPEMINRFRDLGKRVFYVTNNSTKHRREYKTKLDKLGFGGCMDEVIGTAYLSATYLEQINFDKSKLVYVVGSSGITQELDDVGISYLPNGISESLVMDAAVCHGLKQVEEISETVSAVLIGFTPKFSFNDILLANFFLQNPNCLFLQEAPDATFMATSDSGKKFTAPCTGSMVAAVATASGRQPVVLGKPSKFMFEIVQRRHPGIQPERTLMIGDRANTDILLGKNCGLQTLLVGSGVHSLAETRAWEASQDPEQRRMVADFYADKLGNLLDRVTQLEK